MGGDCSKAAVVLSPAIEKALAITNISASTDYLLGHKAVHIRFSYVGDEAGHIRVKFYKTDTDGNFKVVGSYTQQALEKPYAYIVYDKLIPPDLTKRIATSRANGAWDVVMLDYVSATADKTDVDLEYKRQTDYVKFVEEKTWLKKTLGPVDYEDEEIEDDF